MSGSIKTISKTLIIISLLIFLTGCPNDLMRELVEQKLAKPTADSFAINDGSPTSALEVTLNSRVTKEKDRLEMRFKNEGGQWSDWMPYSDRASWVLSIGDGTKKVYAEYRDEGHNVVTMENTIVLNTGAPAGEFYVWGSAISGNRHLYVNSTLVTLCMTISNVETMRFSNDGGSTWSGWTAYSDTREWNMGAGDGPRTINAEFKTNAGTTTPSTRTITVDTVPPVVAGFAINGGDSTTNNINAELGYTYTEANTTWAQYLNDGGSWSADEALDLSGSVSGKGWTLRNVNGTRTVSVRLKDIAGNVSPVYSDSIYLNTEAPDYPVPYTDTPTNDNTPTWEWMAVGGADRYRFRIDGNDWTVIGNVLLWTPTSALIDGIHTFEIQAGDSAGNWSSTGTHTVLIDTIPPGVTQIPVCFEAADGYVNGQEALSGINVTVNLAGTGAEVGDQLDLRINGMSASVTTLIGSQIASEQCIFSITSLGSDGYKSLTAQITDQAGNTGSESSALVFILDTVAPSVPSFSVTPATYTADSTPEWEWSSVPDASIYEFMLNSAVVSATSDTAYTSSTLSEGSHSYTIRSGDAAGNWSAWRSVSSFTIDYTVPVVQGGSLGYQPSTLWGFGAVINWNSATDNIIPQQYLQYRMVYSLSSNIDTPVNANANGITIMNWTNNVTSINASMLSPSTTYYINVIVRDSAGNENVYTTFSMTTPARPILMIGTSAVYNGNLGGRNGADLKVLNEYNSSHGSKGYTNIRCFISVNSGDEIRGMPANYGIPSTGVPVYGPNGTKIADSFEQLISASGIYASLSEAGVSSDRWWSGSRGDGSLLQSCDGWTNGTETGGGTIGSATATNNNQTTGNDWIWSGAWAGSYTWHILGVCW